MDDINGAALAHAHRRHQMLLPRIADARASVEDEATRGEEFVAALDSDGSGALDANEVADSRLARFVNDGNWTRVDTDGDGAISAAELDARHAQVMSAIEAAMTRQTTDV